MISTVPAMLIAGIASGSYFMTQEIDPSKTIAGIDPLFLHIGATLACIGAGWLVGPTMGVWVWTFLHRGKAAQFARRDAEFYARIKRLRADPTRQVVHNPVPDYYGENIGSIQQYRQWIRDQVRKCLMGIRQYTGASQCMASRIHRLGCTLDGGTLESRQRLCFVFGVKKPREALRLLRWRRMACKISDACWLSRSCFEVGFAPTDPCIL